MRYGELSDDLGGLGNGRAFRNLFEQRVRARCGGRRPEDVWDDLYMGFAIKSENKSLTHEEIAIKVMDWFQDQMPR